MKKTLTGYILAASVIATMTGCTATNQDSSLAKTRDSRILMLENELAAKDEKIVAKDKLIMEKNKLIDENEETMTRYSESIASSKTNTSAVNDENAVSNSLVPPNAKTGECYAKVLVPEEYTEKTKQRLAREARTEIKVIPETYKVMEKNVMIRDEDTRIEVVPATYKTLNETIMVKPEKTTIITVPATYKTVKETIMVEPEKTKLTTIPATYKTEKETVLVKSAYTTWKEGRGEIEKVNNSTGDIMCLVEVPAEYRTLTKKVVDVAAHTKEVKTPAVYKTVKRKITDVAAHTKEVKTPAVYKTVAKQVINTPATTRAIKIPSVSKVVKTNVVDTVAKEEKITVPAVYETYSTQVKTSDSYLRWQPILCKTNTTPDVVRNLQQTLNDKGYKAGPVDGVYGYKTKMAVKAYQKDTGLSEGALTIDTLKSLDLM